MPERFATYQGRRYPIPDDVEYTQEGVAQAYREGRLTPTSDPNLTPPERLGRGVQGVYESANTFLDRLHRRTGDILNPKSQLAPTGPMPPWLTELVNITPRSVPEAAVGTAIAALGPLRLAGGPLAQLGKRVGLGTAGGVTVGAADALIRDRPILESATQTGLAGLVGGTLSGAGHAWDAWRTADTRRATDALRHFARDRGASPQVRAALPSAPRDLFDPNTPRTMQDIASRVLQNEVRDISRLEPDQFVLRNVKLKTPPGEPSVSNKLKSLVGVKYTGSNAVTPWESPIVTVESAQRLVAALRQVGDTRQARLAELDIIAHLDAVQLGLGARYQHMIARYSDDEKLINLVRRAQERTALPGGGAPAMRPELAAGSKALGLTPPPTRSLTDALVNALLAASGLRHRGPGFYSAGHATGAARDIERIGTQLVDPTKIGTFSPSWSWLRRYGPTAVGARAAEEIAP